jgi:small subunit ribosomal protein S20
LRDKYGKNSKNSPKLPPIRGLIEFIHPRRILIRAFANSINPFTFAVLIFKHFMANHKSAEKRIRANEAKRVRNRYQAKTTRTFIKKLRTSTVKTEAETLLKEVSSMIDKLAKKNIIHWKKAANQKSKLSKLVNKLA